MSVWAHVAGVVRIDDIRFDNNNPPDFDKIFGAEFDYEELSDANYYFGKMMPCGSEGTLHKSVYINPDCSHISSYTVSIFGDLRDFYSSKEIIDWFTDCLKNLAVRQASILVEIERDDSVFVIYDHRGKVIETKIPKNIGEENEQ